MFTTLSSHSMILTTAQWFVAAFRPRTFRRSSTASPVFNGFDSTATFAVPLEFVEFVEAQLLEMRKGKQLSVKGARLKEKLYSRTWETFAYTIVSAILEDLVNAIVGPKAALAKEIKWNETVEIARLVEVVAWEQGVLLEDKTSAKDWRGKAPRAGGSRDVDEEESPAKRTRRSPGSNY